MRGGKPGVWPPARSLRTVAERLEELVRRWEAAEQRLYPLVIVRPELYERCVSLVRLVADDLRSAGTPEQLAAVYIDGRELVEAVIGRGGVAAEGMDLEMVLGAAFGLRYREVLAEVAREEATRRVVAARKHGDHWVVLHETSGAAGPQAPPYRRLEMHLPDGAGLHLFVELGPEMDRWLYGVEAIHLDPETGDWVGERAPLSERRTFTDPRTWTAAVEELRARYGGGPP